MMGFLQLSSALVYVKLRPDLLAAREINSGYELREPPLVTGAGAGKAIIRHGCELSNDEPSSLEFGPGGRVLN